MFSASSSAVTTAQTHEDDVFSLVTKLHRAALTVVIASAGVHTNGLQQGGRKLRLSSKWQRKLRDLDTVSAWCRHISKFKVDEFMKDLNLEIAATLANTYGDISRDDAESMPNPLKQDGASVPVDASVHVDALKQGGASNTWRCSSVHVGASVHGGALNQDGASVRVDATLPGDALKQGDASVQNGALEHDNALKQDGASVHVDASVHVNATVPSGALKQVDGSVHGGALAQDDASVHVDAKLCNGALPAVPDGLFGKPHDKASIKPTVFDNSDGFMAHSFSHSGNCVQLHRVVAGPLTRNSSASTGGLPKAASSKEKLDDPESGRAILARTMEKLKNLQQSMNDD